MKITKHVKSEYARYRREGQTAQQALRSARVAVRFRELEAKGRARLVAQPEYEAHDDSYIETWGMGKGHEKAAKKRVHDLIDRKGLWMYTSQVKNRKGEWESVDSIGDVIGDIKDTGYDIDLMNAAITKLTPKTRRSR